MDLGTRSYRSDRTSWPSGSFRTSHRFGSRACLLLFFIFIVAQPIAEIGPKNAPHSLLIALADSFTPLGASLKSIRPDLSRGTSVFLLTAAPVPAFQPNADSKRKGRPAFPEL